MRRALALLALLVVTAPAPASAHVGHVIRRAERYLKLDVAGHDVRVVVSLTLGPAEGERVLRAADGDEDGDVTRAEADAYLAQWGDGLVDELPVTLDGGPAPLTWGEGFFEPIGRVRPVPLTVEMVARFELVGGEETVRFEDRMVRREVFERTDVAFDVRDGAELVRSGVADDADEPTPELAYGGTFRPGETVALVAVLRTPARVASSSSGPWWWWLVGAAALGLLILFGRRGD